MMSEISNDPFVDNILTQPLEDLRGATIERLSQARDGLVRWADKVRDGNAPFRFRWAIESLRGSNVAAGSYIMSGLRRAGVLDRVLGDADREAGIEWIKSLEVGPGSYDDPALLAYQPPAGRKPVKDGRPPARIRRL